MGVNEKPLKPSIIKRIMEKEIEGGNTECRNIADTCQRQ